MVVRDLSEISSGGGGKRKQKQKKNGKQKKARAKRMEANCKKLLKPLHLSKSRIILEPIGPLSLHYERISGLLKTQRPYTQYAFEKGLFTNE